MASESDSDAEDGPPSPVSATRESIQPLPQHQCEVQLNHLTFSSRICSGNMAKAEIDEDEEGEYNVWTTPDCAGSPHATTCRSWFYFAVRGGEVGETIGITVMNSNIQNKLYKKGYKPVWRGAQSSPKWKPLPRRVFTSVEEEDYQIRWEHTFAAAEEVQFAFCYPSSFEESEARIAECERAVLDPAVAEKIYFKSEVLTRSLEGRPMRLLTLTSPQGMRKTGEAPSDRLFPDDPARADGARSFKGKPIIFISCRVHPGETPAQHVYNGLVDLLMSRSDPRATALRSRYVFKLVPILNPDGVARGHYRTDTLGQNLNRFYHDPSPELHPTIFAAKQYVVERAREGLMHMYMDLHAHATRRGCFIFGNNTSTTESLVDTLLFSKLISMSSPHFDFNQCNYTEKNMQRKDRRDGLSKSGSGRVGIYRETGLTHIYTLECNYNTGLTVNAIKAASGKGERLASPARDASVEPSRYTQDDFEQLGRAVGASILDLVGANPWSRLPNTRHKSLEGVRKWVQQYIDRSRRRDGKSIVSAECGDEVETDCKPAPPVGAPVGVGAADDDELAPEGVASARAATKRRPNSGRGGPVSARSGGRAESRMLERERLKAANPQQQQQPQQQPPRNAAASVGPASARERMAAQLASPTGSGRRAGSNSRERVRERERARSPGGLAGGFSGSSRTAATLARPAAGRVLQRQSTGMEVVSVGSARGGGGGEVTAQQRRGETIAAAAASDRGLVGAAAERRGDVVRGVSAAAGDASARRVVKGMRVRPNRANTTTPPVGAAPAVQLHHPPAVAGFGRRAGGGNTGGSGAIGGPLLAAQQRRAAAMKTVAAAGGLQGAGARGSPTGTGGLRHPTGWLGGE
jgi:hypothetical protein